jgi:hypothetical protein
MEHLLYKEKRKPCISITDYAKNKQIIFGHEVSTLSSTKSEMIKHYPERALIMARNDKDKVILNQPIDPQYLNFMKNLGIGPLEVITLNSSDIYSGIKESNLTKSSAVYSPFISRQQDNNIVEKIATEYMGNEHRITEKYYNKASFKNICAELGIETAPGTIFYKTGNLLEDRKNISEMIDKNMALTGEVIIRDTNGEGGFNILIANKDNKRDIIEKALSISANFLIESKLPLNSSPCVIGLIDENGPTLVAVSKQILKNGKEYSGSILDYNEAVNSKIYKTFIRLGEKMHQDSYRGPFGIDYLETADGNRLPCECNARVNGSFYPHELKQRLSEKGYDFPIVYSYKTSISNCDSFSSLINQSEVSDMLYKGDKVSGIIPYNVSTIPYGEITFATVAKSHDEAKSLTRKFKNLIMAINEKKKVACL